MMADDCSNGDNTGSVTMRLGGTDPVKQDVGDRGVPGARQRKPSIFG
jgi:hypothetical protein